MKKFINSLASVYLFLLCSAALHAKPSLNLNNAMDYVIRHIPPVFTDIEVLPDPPVAGQDIQIQALIQSKIELKKVVLYFRTKGEVEWKEMEFEQDFDNEKLWVATLPPQN